MLPIQPLLPIPALRGLEHAATHWVSAKEKAEETQEAVTDNSCRLFAASALLMTLATSLLIWLYSVVNGKEVSKLGKGQTNGKAQNGKAKGAPHAWFLERP